MEQELCATYVYQETKDDSERKRARASAIRRADRENLITIVNFASYGPIGKRLYICVLKIGDLTIKVKDAPSEEAGELFAYWLAQKNETICNWARAIEYPIQADNVFGAITMMKDMGFRGDVQETVNFVVAMSVSSGKEWDNEVHRGWLKQIFDAVKQGKDPVWIAELYPEPTQRKVDEAETKVESLADRLKQIELNPSVEADLTTHYVFKRTMRKYNDCVHFAKALEKHDTFDEMQETFRMFLSNFLGTEHHFDTWDYVCPVAVEARDLHKIMAMSNWNEDWRTEQMQRSLSRILDKHDVFYTKEEEEELKPLEYHERSLKCRYCTYLSSDDFIMSELIACLMMRASRRNKLMHALNGNIKNHSKKQNSKKEVKQEVKKEVKRELRKEVAMPKAIMVSKNNGKKFTKQISSKNKAKMVDQGEFAKAKTSMSKVARAISMPLAGAPVRWSSNFSCGATAIANPWASEDTLWNPTTTDSLLKHGDSVFFLFRDPIRHSVMYKYYSSDTDWQYMAWKTGINPENPPNAANDFITTANKEVSFKIPYMYDITTLGKSGPHGAIWFGGAFHDDEYRYFYFSANTLITLTYTCPGSATMTWYINQFYNHNIQEHVQSMTATGTGTTLTLTVAESGYYSISVVSNVTQECALETLTVKGGSTFGHQCLPHLNNNLSSAENIRMVASAICITNKAAELSRCGKVCTVQVPATKEWDELAFKLADIDSSNGAVTMGFEKGVYTYLKPTQPEDFDFKSYVEVNDNGILMDSFYPIVPESAYLAIHVNVQNVDGRNSLAVISSGIEYQTQDTWRVTDVAKTDLIGQSKGLEEIKYLRQVYENPTHFGDIMRQIREAASRVGKAVIEYGPTAMKIASMFV